MTKNTLRTLLVSTTALFSIGTASIGTAAAATLYVGPGMTYATPCRAFAAAVSGDIVQIAAARSSMCR